MQEKNTRVVNCRKDSYDIYIGRPSLWGNPFEIGKDGMNGLIAYINYLVENE